MEFIEEILVVTWGRLFVAFQPKKPRNLIVQRVHLVGKVLARQTRLAVASLNLSELKRRNFHGRFLRSGEISLQNRAILPIQRESETLNTYHLERRATLRKYTQKLVLELQISLIVLIRRTSFFAQKTNPRHYDDANRDPVYADPSAAIQMHA